MTPRLRCALKCLVALAPLFVSTVDAGPPKLNYLSPAGVQRGQTAEVTANGSWDTWPVTAWTNRPGLEITVEADKGKLKIRADEAAEPGWVWLRLVNAEGASEIRPFAIGVLPEIADTEPNDDGNRPQMLEASAVINGAFNKQNDVDTFGIQLGAGQTVVASMQANHELGSPVDAVLQICDANRFVLAQNDDARGLDPLLTFQAPREGRYLVRAFGFPATPDSRIGFTGAETFRYRLTVTTGGFVDYPLPLAVSRGASTEVRFHGWNLPDGSPTVTVGPTDAAVVHTIAPSSANALTLPVVDHPSVVASADSSVAAPQPVVVPSTITGSLPVPRKEDVFTLAGKKGQTLVLTLDSDELGYLLDGQLLVTDQAGKILVENDNARKARDPQLDFNPPADGDYRLIVRDVHGHGGPGYVYRLTIEEARPDFALTIDGDAFTVAAGGSVEVPVTIDRRRGFAEELEVFVEGLPAGVTAELVRSAKDGDSAKAVKLKLQAAADATSGPFQVRGRTMGETPRVKTAALKTEGLPAHVQHAWITVTPAK